MGKTELNRFRQTGIEKYDDFIVPMLAKPVEKPFNGDDWLFEIKWDGYRAIAEADNGKVRLYSRNGLNLEYRFPSLAQTLKSFKNNFTLDGEIVVLDSKNRPNFQSLQSYDDDSDGQLVYYVFDILSLNRKSTTGLSLIERKELLKKNLPENPSIFYCDHIDKEGIDFFNSAVENNIEGIIGKRALSLYHPGKRNGDWVKIKNVQAQEVIIAGFTKPNGGRKHFGSLILGLYKHKKLSYAGHVGTGFTDKTLRDVHDVLKPLITKTSPFAEPVPERAKATWVKPVLVANIKFTEITNSNQFRHPVFLGLRNDKKATGVHVEIPEKMNAAEINKSSKKAVMKKAKDDKEIKVNGHSLKLTHFDKLYFPDDGISKGDIIEYYSTMHKYVLKYVKDRPQSLRRTPNGILDDGFFQKDAPDERPDWVITEPVHSGTNNKVIHYIICNDKATLLYMANLGCIEINPWNSRRQNHDKPDWVVIDIDPSEENTFQQVIETAQAVKAVLDHAGIVGYPKTSGSTGIHVYIPMGAKYTYNETRDFAKLIASLTNQLLPKFTTLERALKNRKGRIYIDYLQNRAGQTLATAYSARPKKGATVSTPVSWEEVREGLHPSQFTIKNIAERIEKTGDLFAPVLGKGVDINKAMRRLVKDL